MKKFIRLFYPNRIRKKLIIYFMITTLIMAVACFFSYSSAQMLALAMDAIFENNQYLSNISDNVASVQSALESYLATSHSGSLNNYYKYSSTLRKTGEEIGSMFDDTESGLLLHDIGNMILTYLDYSDSAISAKRGRDIEGYTQNYTEASKVYDYINLYIERLTQNQFQENTKVYTMIAGKLGYILLINLLVILAVIVFNVVFIIRMTFKITQPIISLAKAANEISNGNYDVELVTVNSDDEIGVMANAFNRMAQSIRNQMAAMREKAELEARLKEQEMQNLLMKSHLKETQLRALQSQINPHFIFNTLNAAAQLAMFEDADRTYHFIECFSNLFRYNLRSLDSPVTLGDEVQNINNYISLLKVRYDDRINYVQEVDENVLDIPIPCMVLQPLVENAFIHGISELESGGTISLKVRDDGTNYTVEIADNGAGMSQETIDRVIGGNSGEEKPSGSMGHTTGIGIRNVLLRLRNFFDYEDVMEIISEKPGGTRVIIRIPKICVQRRKECLNA